jgi:hypothetical protein
MVLQVFAPERIATFSGNVSSATIESMSNAVDVLMINCVRHECRIRGRSGDMCKSDFDVCGSGAVCSYFSAPITPILQVKISSPRIPGLGSDAHCHMIMLLGWKIMTTITDSHLYVTCV